MEGELTIYSIKDQNFNYPQEKFIEEIFWRFNICNLYTKFICCYFNDLLYISTPPKFHAEAVYKGLKNKWNIFCEKPLVNNNKELNKIKNNKKLFVNYNYRFGYLSRLIENRQKPNNI